jgi:hypothetical protein
MCLGNLSPSSARTSSSALADVAAGSGEAFQVGDRLNVPNDYIVPVHILALIAPGLLANTGVVYAACLFC